jgi:CDP-paratose 2-epimerase
MVSQGWIVWFVLAKLLGKQLTFYGFNGKQVRDYLHIDDLFDLISLQIHSLQSKKCSVYNVGGGCKNTVSVLELSQKLDKMLGIDSTISHEKPRREDQKIFISDISKVSKEHAWSPKISLDDGLSDVIDWLKSNDLSWLKL